MSKPIRLAALYPSHLDLNGDHGNLLVLERRLEWRGVSAEIVPITKPTDLDAFDFVLLGHGSNDAWADVERIDKMLISNVAKLVQAGKPVMAINSGYEKLIVELENISIERIERVSEFKDVDGIVGYVNSDALLPEVKRINNSYLSLFHGPLFVKNPQLADQIISSAGWCNISEVNSVIEAVDDLAKESRKIAFED